MSRGRAELLGGNWLSVIGADELRARDGWFRRLRTGSGALQRPAGPESRTGG